MDRVGGNSSDLRPPGRWIAALCALVAAGGVALGLGLGLAGSMFAGSTPPALGSAAPASIMAWLALQALTLLVLLAGVAVALRIGWQQHRSAAELREARARLRCLDELLDLWQWRTDAEHRLVLLRPPQGAPGADWSGATAGVPLWQHFKVAHEAALRARLASHAPLDDIAVQRESAAGGPRAYRLRGRIRTDAMGRFAGYHGILRENDDGLAARGSAALATHDATRDAAPDPAAPTPAAAPGGFESDHESFSFTVSHDLRAPIRVVEGFTKIVKEDYGRLLDRVGNDHLDRVLGAAARMNNMIDALLALAKLSSQPLARQPVNLSQLAAYVADDLRRHWPEREVRIDIEPGLLVQGDPTLLRVVIENLLGNAWKYSAKAAQPHIVFERRAGGDGAFTVRDNGAGFDMRFADRLFGVFQRLHSANDFPGTGVGLASVRRIVRRHGGEIWGEAEVNHGARFHFSLPPDAPRR